MKKILFILMMALMPLSHTLATNSFDNKQKIEYVKIDMPAIVKLYTGDSIQVKIRSNDRNIQDNIKYRIDKDKKSIDIWLENFIPDEIFNIDSKNIRIAISSPKDLKIKTDSNLSIKYYSYKKNFGTSYENE